MGAVSGLRVIRLQTARKPPGGRRLSISYAWLRGTDSNRRPSGYEPDELPLLHPADAAYQRPRCGSNCATRQAVRAVRTATPTQSEMVLTTDHLHVVPDDDYARTDSPVKIVDANTQVTADGLEFNNNAKVVKLLSNVRGSYVRK